MAHSLSNVLPDNTVKYSLFPALSGNEQDVEAQLTSYLNDSFAKLSPYLTDYIWQIEPFNLHIVQDNQGKYLFNLIV